jgi:asparagine synthase (glutamine-hydrolysing)
MGFSIPLAAWLRGGLRGMAEDLLLSDRARGRGYFQPSRISAMWTEHQAIRRDHSHQLWALMMLELWHREFLDGGA